MLFSNYFNKPNNHMKLKVRKYKNTHKVLKGKGENVADRRHPVAVNCEMVLLYDVHVPVHAQTTALYCIPKGSVIFIREIYCEEGMLVVYFSHKGQEREVLFKTREYLQTKEQLLGALSGVALKLPKTDTGRYPESFTHFSLAHGSVEIKVHQ